jgi:membrane-associated phospholipid phosphatase
MTWRPDVPQRLLPARFRTAAIVIICACAAVTAALGLLFAHHTTGSALDNAVERIVQGGQNFGPGGGPGGPGARRLLLPFGMLGTTPLLALVTVFLAYCCLGLRRYRGAVMLAAGVILGSVLSELVIKPLVDRTRYGSLSYPSGHATAAFAVATAIIVLLVQPPDTRMPVSMRVVLGVLTAGIAGTISVGLTGIHYFTDTVGGAGVGISVTLLVTLLLDHFNVAGPRAEVQAPRPAESAKVT